MSTIEEIQAAIDKLTKLKAESTPKPWHDWEDDLTGEVDLWHDQEQRLHIANVGVAGMPRVEADAELITVLHRTIDAQLALLTHTVEIRGKYVEQGFERHWEAAVRDAGDLDLARAINGGTQ
jgi:hypothetical protein